MLEPRVPLASSREAHAAGLQLPARMSAKPDHTRPPLTRTTRRIACRRPPPTPPLPRQSAAAARRSRARGSGTGAMAGAQVLSAPPALPRTSLLVAPLPLPLSGVSDVSGGAAAAAASSSTAPTRMD